ncbi:thyroglobulin type-1 repeat-containing domain protein, partial [Teladorsagia circumcincta]
SSAAGPCMLNDDGLKCTKKGYYETIQCDTRGCFCVSANTGLRAFDTRTTSNKTSPKCSVCHNALKDLFADGNVPQGTFVPKCNVILGGRPVPTLGPKLNKEDCPLDHSCRMGAFFGTCCTQANEDRFDAAYNRKCGNGREPYSIPKDGWREVLRGKTCQDNFCPTGYKCQDNDVFAICC